MAYPSRTSCQIDSCKLRTEARRGILGYGHCPDIRSSSSQLSADATSVKRVGFIAECLGTLEAVAVLDSRLEQTEAQTKAAAPLQGEKHTGNPSSFSVSVR
ncbi:hypothetical protein ColLi_00712 [Colletotrichum liriopes]|uniref:Uncharacterized protein n=1 Tax=Colletotrichum liriopes TaxID=708192 RepID=A0AA37LM96_9PEZI|nr:hypothetical protein ColLi_00712 [Colletotrichum liriopes]